MADIAAHVEVNITIISKTTPQVVLTIASQGQFVMKSGTLF